MRKGDEKRQEMLAVAERLFCTKGYEATSVQDILDVLHASKGGFYHHFASKEMVLDTLCTQRAERAGVRTEDSLAALTDDMARLNCVLYGMIPLRREEAPFLNMILPLLEKPEGRALRVSYQEALAAEFQPILEREMALAQDDGVICPPAQEFAGLILSLINRCWLEVALHLLDSVHKAQRYEPGTLLTILEKYRRAVEVLLDAPYGSVEIVRLEEWAEVAGGVVRNLLMPMRGV